MLRDSEPVITPEAEDTDTPTDATPTDTTPSEEAPTEEVIVEPVSLELAKAHLRVIDDTDDLYIKQLISDAREYAEGYHHVIYAERSFTDTRDDLPDIIKLENKPATELASVIYTDDEGTEHDVTDNYILDTKKSRLVAKTTLHIDNFAMVNPVAITYKAGMKPRARTVQAMLIIMGEHYENREASVIGVGTYELKLSVKQLLEMDRHPTL